jgi:hypothetical protein
LQGGNSQDGNLTKKQQKRLKKGLEMTKKDFILYAQRVAEHIGTAEPVRVLDSYYMNTETMRNTIAALGGRVAARDLLAAHIKKSENELFYI